MEAPGYHVLRRPPTDVRVPIYDRSGVPAPAVVHGTADPRWTRHIAAAPRTPRDADVADFPRARDTQAPAGYGHTTGAVVVRDADRPLLGRDTDERWIAPGRSGGPTPRMDRSATGDYVYPDPDIYSLGARPAAYSGPKALQRTRRAAGYALPPLAEDEQFRTTRDHHATEARVRPEGPDVHAAVPMGPAAPGHRGDALPLRTAPTDTGGRTAWGAFAAHDVMPQREGDRPLTRAQDTWDVPVRGGPLPTPLRPPVAALVQRVSGHVREAM